MSNAVSEFIGTEAFNTLCGPKLGEGIHRQVFLCAFDPNLVVKVEMSEWNDFANVHEWRHWNDLSFAPDFNRWLAPCVRISPNGRILLQKRCERAAQHQLPKELPAWLTDVKAENFGWFEGRLVCHDYPTIIDRGLSKRMKKVDWR